MQEEEDMLIICTNYLVRAAFSSFRFLDTLKMSTKTLRGEGMSEEEKGNTYVNKLIDEKSPYLLQHAHNPVDWYPWGEEAFEKAKKEDKPVLVSIGYSTCHWCHVG